MHVTQHCELLKQICQRNIYLYHITRSYYTARVHKQIIIKQRHSTNQNNYTNQKIQWD